MICFPGKPEDLSMLSQNSCKTRHEQQEERQKLRNTTEVQKLAILSYTAVKEVDWKQMPNTKINHQTFIFKRWSQQVRDHTQEVCDLSIQSMAGQEEIGRDSLRQDARMRKGGVRRHQPAAKKARLVENEITSHEPRSKA